MEQIDGLIEAFFKDPLNVDALHNFRKKVFPLSSFDVPNHQSIGRWIQSDLLIGKDKGVKSHVKFSLVEGIWLLIVKELRDGFNFPNDKIVKVKETSFRRPTLLDPFAIEYYLLLSILDDVKHFLIISNEGGSDIVNYEEYKEKILEGESMKSHIVFRLDELYRKVLSTTFEKSNSFDLFPHNIVYCDIILNICSQNSLHQKYQNKNKPNNNTKLGNAIVEPKLLY